MGGQEGMRGYLLQTILGLLNAIEEDNDWVKLEFEPNNESEKVDVRYHYLGKIKSVQVKSSNKAFKPKQIRDWVGDLKTSAIADDYELVLVGHIPTTLIDVRD